MLYGSLEFACAEPFANSLVNDAGFRRWVVAKTKFGTVADEAHLLSREMTAQRSSNSATWWRSHFTERCRCSGCSGQETDLLAIFETDHSNRFALHFEFKQPTDRFSSKRDQAGNYALRAACWARSAPRAVLPHSDASTILVCSTSKLSEYGPHLPKFGAVITFEEIAASFPKATLKTKPADSASQVL